MARGFGICAVIVAVIGAFVPFFGFWVGVAALIVATAGALAGDKVFAIVTVCISLAVFVFLTPSLFALPVLWVVAVVALCLPVVGIILHATGKLIIGKTVSEPPAAGGDGS